MIFDSGLFIIAEISANHNNDLNLAYKTIDAIAETGADAVKIQTYTADSLTMNVDNEFFGPKKDGLWKGKTLYDLFEKGSLPYSWHADIKKYVESKGLIFFSSPFDRAGVDLLEKLEVKLYKIASPEITDIPLIRYVASKGKPMIISTGMADLSDIQLALDTCRAEGNINVTLLKCTSEYPAPVDMANLKTIPNLRDTFDVNVGLSDHTVGSTVPVVAVALGATVIEKHITLNRASGGIDASFSMEPHEFKAMVDAARDAQLSLGTISYKLKDANKLRRRSLFVHQDIKKGDIISLDNVRTVRPGHGLHPKYLDEILGSIASQDIKKGTPLQFNHFSK